MTVTAGEQKRQKRARSLKDVVDFAMGSHLRAAAVLLVIACLGFLPGLFSIPPIDRDETRFAQATKQMVESGDYIDIRFQDEVRYKKPVGIYWLQAAVVKTARAFGFRDALTAIWLYRVPSFLGAVAAVLLTYWAALAFVSRRAALLAGLMMATCVLLGIERLLAKTDAMLLMTVVAAMGAMARAYFSAIGRDRNPQPIPPPRAGEGGVGAQWRVAAIFWTALAAGVLLKGPLILMIVALAALTLGIVDRSARWFLQLKPVAGVVWFAILVVPWFIAIIGRSGGEFLAESVGEDLLSKIFTAQEAHGAPPGFYLVLFWLTFWPGAMLAGVAAPSIWAARREPATKFLLAWVVPSWIIFELVITKLPHYVLPLYPAIAILIAGAVDAHALSEKRWLVWGTVWWFIGPLVTGIGGIVILAVIGRQFGLLAWPLIGAAVVMGLLAWRLYEVDGAEHSLLRAAAAAVLSAIAIFSFVVPGLTYLFPSPTLARILRNSGCAHAEVAAVGYQEPSLVFLAGTDVRLTDSAAAAEFLRGGECRFAFIEQRQEKNFAQRADAIGLRYTAGPRIEGMNISTGQAISIAIYISLERP
jgi:4-amino-4-deoxy-L-arabinose transferase-like glycosyltransferase